MQLRITVGTLVGLTASLVSTSSFAANYAAAVTEFIPGTGASNGYDQTSSILGEPSRVTPGEFGGPVDPFSSAWQPGQLLSIGAGGSVTVQFAEPIPDLPSNPYGLDFLIFGSAAFLITNGDFSGGGITDGSLFGNINGDSRVSVSADGITFYTLNPALAPSVDAWFPTDGSGDFSRPVDPALGEADFNELGLAGIRARYDGSGGGAGFDIGWARDANGDAVSLGSIGFVRIDVLSDHAEIDALSAIPEPRSRTLFLGGLLALVLARRARRDSRRNPARTAPCA